MAKTGSPRHGSLQYWPHKRSKRTYARVRSYPNSKETKILGFAGYKAGMTHVIFTDNSPNSLTKGQDVSCPVTVIECPPLKVASARFYKTKTKNLVLLTEIISDKLDKELSRKIRLPKKVTKKFDDIKEFDEIRLLVHTQPKLAGVGKKKPEIFEVGIGGSKEDALAYAKDKLGQEIAADEVFGEGSQVDAHAVTKGKGYQGAVKRFGVNLRAKKSEKTKRGVGSLGPWCGQAHIMWRIPMAGKHGFFTRTEYNKWIIKMGTDPKDINAKGGFVNYGEVKSNYMLVKGSIPGSKKRLIRLNSPIRPNRKIQSQAPEISHVSQKSPQGN
jgi:large subunit ribosomal protein L3